MLNLFKTFFKEKETNPTMIAEQKTFEQIVEEILGEEQSIVLKFGDNFLAVRKGMTKQKFFEQIQDMLCEKYRLGINFDIDAISKKFNMTEDEVLEVEKSMDFIKRQVENQILNSSQCLDSRADFIVSRKAQLDDMCRRLPYGYIKKEVFDNVLNSSSLSKDEREAMIKYVFEAEDLYPAKNEEVSSYRLRNSLVKFEKQKMWNASLDTLRSMSDYDIALKYRNTGLNYLTWDY